MKAGCVSSWYNVGSVPEDAAGDAEEPEPAAEDFDDPILMLMPLLLLLLPLPPPPPLLPWSVLQMIASSVDDTAKSSAGDDLR